MIESSGAESSPSSLVVGLCRNISGHALMGRLAARLVKMELAIRLYVLVDIVGKRQYLPLYG